MTRKEKTGIVEQALSQLYPSPQVPLLHKDAYTLLIAVLLSAQCTDARVNLVTPKLFELADSPQKMSEQSPAKVREIIRSCGLSDRKSENIVALSRMLIDRFEGEVPQSFEELEILPGVGHKTASVIMSAAFGFPAFPVDTHVFRLARRWGLSKGNDVVKVERDLKKLFPKTDWGVIHLRMVLFGREYCPARGCGDSCPICKKIIINQ